MTESGNERSVYKSYKYRIYPNPAQKWQIDDTMSTCRYIYNLGLEIKKYAWTSARINISVYELQKQFTEARKEYPWLSRANRTAVDASLRSLDFAYGHFFKGGGFPKFKSKKNRQSFSLRCDTMKIDFDRQLLTVGKIKQIRAVLSRKFVGEIRRITVSKSKSDKYFAAILVKTTESIPTVKNVSPNSTVGVDVGIKSFVVTSDGRAFEPNRFLKNSLKRMQCLQRRASRKKRGSKNRNKASRKIVLLYEKISNQRSDYIHKITSQIICDNQVDSLVIEDLNVTGMMKNGKLALSLADASFGEFFRQVKYKCDWYGKNLITIGQFDPSSKRCSSCGNIKEDLSLDDREWICRCGSIHDRDFNAAKNIRFFGLEKYSRQDMPAGPVELPSLEGAEKQEVVFAK